MAMTPDSDAAVLVPLFAGRQHLKFAGGIVLGRIEASHKDNVMARAWRVVQFFKDACRTPVGSADVVVLSLVTSQFLSKSAAAFSR
jgi:hypothetical protein